MFGLKEKLMEKQKKDTLYKKTSSIAKVVILFIFLVFLTGFSLENTYQIDLEPYDYPKSVYISPDNKNVYVCNLEGQNLLVIDKETKEIIDKVKLPGKPVELTFTKGGRYVWVSLLKKASVAVYDTVSKKVIKNIPVGNEPKILRADPNEKYIFVSNWESQSVSVIDVALKKEIKQIHVGNYPRGIIFHPFKRLAYVAIMGGRNIAEISLDSLEVTDRISDGVGGGPRHLAISQDGKYLYVSCNHISSVQKIDLETKKVLKTIETGINPRTISLSPSEKYLFVVNYKTDSLTVIDTEKMENIYNIATHPHPIGIDISKDEKEIWVANYFPKCSIFVYNFQTQVHPEKQALAY